MQIPPTMQIPSIMQIPKNNRIANTSFKEIEIVNGNIVKDIELNKETDSNKEVIKGYINDRPVIMIRRFTQRKQGIKRKRTNKKHKKSGDKKSRDKKKRKSMTKK